MNTALWVAQGLLAFAMIAAGSTKLLRDKATLRERMAWTDDYSATQIKLIGLVEVLGAIGLVVPWATGILPILTPAAAVGLAVIMIGAAYTHVRRKEGPMTLPAVVLAAIAAFVAYGRH